MLKLQEPAQPCAADWAFIDELKSEFRRKPNWERKVPRLEELDLTEGVRIINYFVDPEGLLETAWEGLERFFKDLSIPIISHKYIFKDKIIEKNAGVKDEDLYQKIEGIADIIIKKEDLDTYESYFIEITKENIVIKAGDTEGIRRGIFYLEDMILSSEGPFLIPTVIERKPWIKNRISRCFFGPIKRPPLNRDELMDDVDYYPDEYLNRLAHEGINVLWLTVEFRDICKTKLVPEYGKERDKRISKLKRTVEKCRRYGIKIFIFCIEPRIWEKDDPLILNNPEMAGATVGDNVCFCPFPEVSQKYLYEAVKSIFTEVPKLGGIFSITHGERPTSCLSSVSATSNTEVNCPRCSKKEKSEILEATHRPIIRAMHEINPDAQFISWPYMSHDLPVAPWVYTIPERLPKETVLAFNFESGIEKEQLGKVRIGGDYWQSLAGPGRRFIGVAKASKKAGINIGAKLQVACSHEVATIPFVPVPPVLWKKYREMYELSVTTAIQSWFFGNYPGIMNKAAGELAFERWDKIDPNKEWAQIEYDFLHRLAKIDWGKHAKHVVKAWYYFYNGYNNYPLNKIFQRYGPMHDGVVWPLHLFPTHTPISPTWKLDYPTSGDSIGEGLYSFTIKDAIELSEDMVRYWKKGMDIYKGLLPEFKDNIERLKDIAVAEALSIQFESGLNILRFYDLREQVLWNDPLEQWHKGLKALSQLGLDKTNSTNCGATQAGLQNGFSQMACLKKMEEIVKDEIRLSSRMAELCEFDSRLGFHSEAEGYKYFPEKLLWRINLLKDLLKNDFPKMKGIIGGAGDEKIDLTKLATPLNAPIYNCCDKVPAKAKTFEWTANLEDKTIFINIICRKIIEKPIKDDLYLHIKAGDLDYPCNVLIDLKKAKMDTNKEIPIENFEHTYKVQRQGTDLIIEFKIYLENMQGFRGQGALALSIVRKTETDKGEFQDFWSGENPHIRYRLNISIYNPGAMGRLQLV